jgi:hypothetical protein
MKISKLPGCCGMRAVTVHLFVESIGQNEMMRELETMRFHGVRGSVIKVAHFGMIKVGYPLL